VQTDRDNAKVPVTLAYKKSLLNYDIEKGVGRYFTISPFLFTTVSLLVAEDFCRAPYNKIMIYAYGAYGISSWPVFDETIYSLLDRGVVYAISHARGGSERGWEWYQNGKMITLIMDV